MDAVIKNLVNRLHPELAQNTHLPQWGKITRIPNPPSAGDLSTEDEPYYAVDVQLLDELSNALGPIYESVPLPVPFAGHQRGAFGFPPVGTRVLIMWVYGSPAHPVITGIYPLDRHLPSIGETGTLWQQSAQTYFHTTEDESVDLHAFNKMRLGNTSVDVVAELELLAQLVAEHKHTSNKPGILTSEPNNTVVIGNVSKKVGSLKM